jgi:serine/threonine-protein kinase RsbW
MSATATSREARTRLDSVHYALDGFWSRLGEGAPEDWKVLFELAVCEIAANIIEHARPPSVHLHLGIHAGSVVAEFTDAGHGWDGPPGPAEMVDQLLERGRGLTLARAALDEMAYERLGQTNRWRLSKLLYPEGAGESQLG